MLTRANNELLDFRAESIIEIFYLNSLPRRLSNEVGHAYGTLIAAWLAFSQASSVAFLGIGIILTGIPHYESDFVV